MESNCRHPYEAKWIDLSPPNNDQVTPTRHLRALPPSFTNPIEYRDSRSDARIFYTSDRASAPPNDGWSPLTSQRQTTTRNAQLAGLSNGKRRKVVSKNTVQPCTPVPTTHSFCAQQCTVLYTTRIVFDYVAVAASTSAFHGCALRCTTAKRRQAAEKSRTIELNEW